MVFKWISRTAALSLAFSSLSLSTLFNQSTAEAQTLDLYVDQSTKQVFTEPGPGRTKLGSFQPAPSGVGESKTPSSQPNTSATNSVAIPSIEKTASLSQERKEQKHWYDKLSFRGYTQLRYTSLLSKEGADWFHPADRTVAKDQTFLIRRGRLIMSGDVSDHLFVYVQPELNASPADGDFSAQLRDLYGDVSFDKKKEINPLLN